IVSSHIAHNGIFNTIRDDKQVYYSIFSKRNRTIDQSLIKSMAHSDKWLVDTNENEHILHQLIETLDTKPEILRFTPFDTQILENLSSQLDETYIGVWIDGLNDDYLQILINDLITYIKRHPSYRLVILT
ncbi:accessory Sec system protein Asp1, partial [Pseudomonas aeruginosa]